MNAWPDIARLALRVKELEDQLDNIRAELSKYLVMSERETIIGGIRNLIQASIMHEDAAKKAMSLWSEYEDQSKGGGPG